MTRARTWFALGLALAGALVLAWLRLPARSAGPEGRPAAPRAAKAPDADPNGALDPPGKWRQARREAPAPVAPETARLAALPYLQGYRPAEGSDRGVTRWDRARTWPGLNLFTSGHAAEAVLMDLSGHPVHRWRRGLTEVWPRLRRDPNSRKLEYYRRARLLPDGDLLAIFEGTGLVRLDRDSKLRWAWRSGAHHDLDLDAAGNIWVLDRAPVLVPEIDPAQEVLEDFVAVLTPQGEVLRRISILRALQRSPWSGLIATLPRRTSDILHPNTLELLDGRLADRVPAFRAGNVLLSICEADTVAVLDPQSETLVWAMTGPFRRQHEPTVLPDGRLMVFDNLGAGKASRILEIDPASQAIVWQFGGRPADDFFSKTLGTAQWLPNGNILIAESENGRAFEITRAGEIVWEYRSPQRAGDHGELVAALFHMERLGADQLPGEWRSAAAR